MTRYDIPLAIAALLAMPAAHGAGSLLRIACEGADARAEVTINGQFKGECPLDVQVNAGTIQLRVAKPIDAERERAYVETFRIGDGVVKKVEAVLKVQLTAEGQRRQLLAEEAKQREAAEQRRKFEDMVAQYRAAADAGDAPAMLALGALHEEGFLPKSKEQANAWYRKAADAGNERAAFRLTPLYQNAPVDPDVVAADRMLGLLRGEQRPDVIDGEDAIRAFVASDRFFQAGGSGKINWTYGKPLGTSRGTFATTCERNGALFSYTILTRYSSATSNTEGEMLLGGVAWLHAKIPHNLFSSTTRRMVRLYGLRGEPFPLKPEQRFGFSADYVMTGPYAGSGKETMHVDCAVTDRPQKIVGAFKVPDGVQQVVCYANHGQHREIARYYLHERSGCLVNVGKP